MKTKKRYSTGFLFSTPSFLSGAGSAMNLAGNYYSYNTSQTSIEADCKAIKNDFRMIGQDIADTIKSDNK